MPHFEEGRALLIGVGDYEKADLEKVMLTANEADAVGKALQDASIAGYPPERVRIKLNAEATRQAIETELQDLATKATAQDTVLVYLASHGDLGEDGEYYFATYDVELTPQRRIVKGSGLSESRLRELIGNIKAQKLLVLINTCFSGEVTGTLSSARGAPPSTAFNYKLLATGQGRAIITASRAAEASYFFKTGTTYTFFGQAVLDAFKGKNINSTSGYVGLFEFYSAVYNSVVETLKPLNAKQEPTLTLSQAVGAFPIALNQGGPMGAMNAGGIQQTPPTDKAVDRVNKEVIEAIHMTVIETSGAGAQAAGGNLVQASGQGARAIGGSLIHFGSDNRFSGPVSMGDVAMGDIIKTYTSAVGKSAAANDQQQVIKLIQDLRADIAKTDALPEDARDDANNALDAAEKAGKQNKRDRLLEKLDQAQQVMLKLSATIPAAVQIGTAIGTLLQRATTLWT